VVWSAIVAAGLSSLGAGVASAQAPGGFVESSTGNGLRARLSAGEIQAFLPARGRFTFPSPYSTTGIRLTNASDCGGSDCVNYVGYSYWRNMNNHVGSDTILAFLGLDRRRGGGGPTLFSYNKNTGETKNLGPMFSPDSPWSWYSGEGWYFSATQANTLYVDDTTSLRRYNVSTHAMETVFDVREQLGADKHVKQFNSSDNDLVHSATVQDANWNATGCMVYLEASHRTIYVAEKGDYDECQVDKSGRWLMIKETIVGPAEDNRIIDLQTGAEKVFYDRQGAGGHSDVAYGYFVGEDDKYAGPGAPARVFRFDEEQSAPDQGLRVYTMSSWNSMGLGHVSHTNARGDVPFNQQMVCSSNADRDNTPRVNEIVCYRLDGSMNALIVAPNMTDLNASGGGSDDYSKRPKGNLDVTGEYFIWTTNMGSGRSDAFIVRIPQSRLGVSGGAPAPSSPAPSPSPAPAPSPTPDPAPAPAPTPAPAPAPVTTAGTLQWMSLINVTANGDSLQKTGGCSGCPDASAVSQNEINGSGALAFVAADRASLQFVGLGSGGIGTAAGDINFAIRLQSGVAEVREAGAYRSETSFNAGDTFQISVDAGTVSYLKNGAVFYTSGTQASYGVRVHAVQFDANATIANVALNGSTGSAVVVVSPEEPAAAPSATVNASTSAGRYAQPRPTASTPKRRRR